MKRSIAVLMMAIAMHATTLSPAVSVADPCRSEPTAYDTGGRTLKRAAVNDPLFKEQWGLRQLNVPSAWNQGATGRGTIIAVIDSGVDLHHPDLRGNLVKGIDLGPEGEAGDCPGPQDEEGHGTTVAGVAAAVGDNGIGTVGVAPHASVMPIQATHLHEIEGPLAGLEKIEEFNRRVAEGIRYAADHGADVINISMSTFFYVEMPGTGVASAIQYAWDKGVLVVAAAGNDEDPFCMYPAGDPLALCVGAVDRDGGVSAYSSDPAKPSGDTAVLGPAGNSSSQKCETSDLTWSTMLPVQWDCGVGGYATNGGTSMGKSVV